MLLRASWVSDVMQLIGITGISQVWDDQPEWYLWLSGQPGPYSLILEQTFDRSVSGNSWIGGYFSIKCFPDKDSPVFSNFSIDEQEMLDSALFDHTRTPVLNTKSKIPTSYYNIGALLICTELKENGGSIFTFESLDSLRIIKPACNHKPSGDISSQDIKLLRCVSGWELGYPLFDAIVSLYSFYRHQPPVWFRMTKSPGFEYVQKQEGNLDLQPCANNQVLSTSLLFWKDGPSLQVENLPELESEEEVMVEGCLDESVMAPERRKAFHLNKLWWHFAQHNFSSNVTSPCGCGNNCIH